MFHRAQFLVRQGDNVVAQRLLLRCLELNPFDSHRLVPYSLDIYDLLSVHVYTKVY